VGVAEARGADVPPDRFLQKPIDLEALRSTPATY
jgi:hypothetical protein